MTSQTPAGWYPDPGQTPDGPRSERWWDGSRWTDQTRPASTAPPLPQGAPAAPATPPAPPAPAQQPTAPGTFPAYGNQPGYPGHPGYPGQLPPKPRSRARIAVAAGVAVVVLAGIVGGVYALTADDGKGGSDTVADESASPKRSLPPKGPEGGDGSDGGAGGGSEAPQDPESPRPPLDKGFATDVAFGIALPVLDGWTGVDGVGAAGATTGPYKCPDDTAKTCVKGGVSSASARSLKLTSKTAEAAAKEDIAKNAEASYGGKTYGGLVQHDQLVSKKVTVAGQQGYRVRWTVDTKSDLDAWVESVAFPSPRDPKTIIVLRIGVDVPKSAKDKAAGPDDAAIDKIVAGVKESKITSGATGGSGENV
jgi:hypothetical protein